MSLKVIDSKRENVICIKDITSLSNYYVTSDNEDMAGVEEYKLLLGISRKREYFYCWFDFFTSEMSQEFNSIGEAIRNELKKGNEVYAFEDLADFVEDLAMNCGRL